MMITVLMLLPFNILNEDGGGFDPKIYYFPN